MEAYAQVQQEVLPLTFWVCLNFEDAHIAQARGVLVAGIVGWIPRRLC